MGAFTSPATCATHCEHSTSCGGVPLTPCTRISTILSGLGLGPNPLEPAPAAGVPLSLLLMPAPPKGAAGLQDRHPAARRAERRALGQAQHVPVEPQRLVVVRGGHHQPQFTDLRAVRHRGLLRPPLTAANRR